tara:strand:+ start:1037 stop:2356 length:1320 start_codon:yes stop_codon:yes gene_type:complete
MKNFYASASTFALLIAFSALSPAQSDVSKNSTETSRGPSLEISGETNVLFYSFNQGKKEANNGKGQGSHISVEDSRLNFRFSGRADVLGGLEYTGFIGITGNTEAGKTSVEENWIMLRNGHGRLIVGGHRGVADRMATGAFSVMGSTGGFDGNYKNVVNVSTGVNRSTDMVGIQKDSNKVTFVLPRYYGLQAGVSFTPHGEQQGEAKLRTISSRSSGINPYDKNNVELGVNYKTDLQGLGVKTSLTVLTGQSQPIRRRGTSPVNSEGRRFSETLYSGERSNSLSYALGLLLTYGNFEAGFEFIDNGESQVLKAIKDRDAGQMYTVAAGYTFGANKIALGYQFSERKLGTRIEHFGQTDIVAADNPKAKAKVISLTYDHKLAKGLSVFAEANYFDFKTDDRWVQAQEKARTSGATGASSISEGVGNNHGHVFMLGTKVRF